MSLLTSGVRYARDLETWSIEARFLMDCAFVKVIVITQSTGIQKELNHFYFKIENLKNTMDNKTNIQTYKNH